MTASEPAGRPTLAYAATPARLNPRDVAWAVLPALVVLSAGVALAVGIVEWLRLQYGPDAITQWTANFARVEFWYLKVPFCGWLVLWALALVASLRRCTTIPGRQLSIGVGVLALLVFGLSFVVMMDGPFP